MIYVLTGNGKGKTTSALGMGLRAVGSGKKVLMIQFLKDGSSSEVRAISRIKGFEIKSFGRKGFGPYTKKDARLAKSGFLFAQKAAKSQKHDSLILDEVSVAINFNLLMVSEVVEFLREYGTKLDIVLTGRYCPEEIIKNADLVTEFKEIKHYFNKDIKARKGIEY